MLVGAEVVVIFLEGGYREYGNSVFSIQACCRPKVYLNHIFFSTDTFWPQELERALFQTMLGAGPMLSAKDVRLLAVCMEVPLIVMV